MEDSVSTELDTLIQYYENSEESTEESRRASERDRDYYDHKQLTEEEIRTLKKRKQPVIQTNRIKPKIDSLLGVERQIRTDPKAYPRTPKHDEEADAATDALRYVVENNDFDYKRSAVFESMLIEGTGGCEILVKEKKGKAEIIITEYPWDRLFWDPHSRRRDFSDAKYKGAVIWMDTDDAKSLGNPEVIEAAMMSSTSSDTFDDTPRIRWIDKSRNRVKICLIWYLDKGIWHRALFTEAGFINEPEQSRFKDENGDPECALEIQSAFVDRDGNRYGAVRTMIDPQDAINKHSSKALHLISMRQTLSEKGAVDDVARTKRELAKPDGHVEINPGLRFELLNTNDMAQGVLALMQDAKANIDSVGVNESLQGKEDRSMSGRALMAREQAGMRELGPLTDSLRAWQKRVYRQCWNRIRQYWTEERWIRVTDDDDNLKWVGLNRPVTVQEKLEKDLGPVPEQMANDPRLKQSAGIENPIAELDVDIILEDVPDTVNIQAEQFEMLVQMYQANPKRNDNPEGIPWEMIIEASTLRNKDKALGKDEEGQDPEKQAMLAQMQQIQQQMQQMAQENEQLKAAQEVKSAELQVKKVESERRLRETEIKHQTTLTKAEADVYIANLNAKVDAEALEETKKSNGEQTGAMTEAIGQMLALNQQATREANAELAQAITYMGQAVAQPKDKTVSMKVNGKTYVGEVTEQ